MDGRIDIAVHSAKDVPTQLPEGLELVAIPERADPRDAICGASSLAELPAGATVGTSSLRRAAQIRAVRDDLEVISVRGNVDTRLRKLAEGQFDAIVLALAGLERLGRADEAGGVLAELVPAAGQGALAIEARAGAIPAELLAAVSDPEATACVTAERELVGALDASCNTPVGAHARRLEQRRARAGRLGGTARRLGMDSRSPDRRRRRPRECACAAAAERRRGRAAAAGRARGERRMTVYLVGAGPGDPGLLTARALELIAGADVIVYDRLIPAAALEGARADARLLYAGKEGGGPSVSQEEIDALLVEHGRAGKSVVRLKGGDPFVFGRGGEEAEALRAAGIPFEVVPGVTAGVAAPAYAGIPVTHRDAASAVAFVTGHEDPAKPESALDWRALAAFPGTLVVYMGVRRLAAIAEQLIAGGRDAEQPAAVIERGTFPGQRVVTATLGSIASSAEEQRIRAPAIAVFGEVAALRERLRWFEDRPLSGVSVAVTRARAQASGLASRLRALGAEVVEAPAIRISPLEGSLPDLRGYDLVCLTSPNGVRLLLERMASAGHRCARTVGCPDRGDRPRHRRRAARARPDRGCRPGAVRRRGPGRGAGRRAGRPSARGARRRGPRRASGRTARARRRGRRRGPV